MITLYSFGPAFGLPDPSPFVTKAETLLKMAGLDYTVDTATLFKKAPKGKLPYIEDDCEIIGDSTFIRWHIEKKYGFDFDRGLNPEQRAIAWAFEKMLEEHLYWTVVHARWMDDANFDKGPRAFFQGVPAPMRPFVLGMIRRKIRRALHGQGTGRHARDEIVALGTRSIDSAANFLADKPFMMGAEPTGLDATAFAFCAGLLCPFFETPLRGAAERHGNLRRYVGRVGARFYPDRREIAQYAA
ncbi:MAG: glutathione S-transferase family protein [Methyloceanibacter sp.]|uniref:glutathione S-transferase family protein n=1 Tax=Methyloceanibacter sp. TaxID=1965321 RepID=UPI003D6CA343